MPDVAGAAPPSGSRRRQAGQVAVDVTHHHEVHQQQIDRRVAAALADAERGAVQPRRARFERGDAADATPKPRSRCPCQSMPTSTPQLGDQRLHELHDRPGAVGRRVADGVGDAQPRGAGANRGRVEQAQLLGIGPRRVLGDVHHRRALASTAKPIASSVHFRR